MALDYIIGGLQLLSAAVNMLALAAFWISPGLRATANRFVINLLVANIIACLALTPALWLHGGLKTRLHMDNSVTPMPDIVFHTPNQQFDHRSSQHTDELYDSTTVEPLHRRTHHLHGRIERDLSRPEYIDAESINGKTIEESIESVVIERDEKGYIRKFREKQVIDIQNGDKKDVIEIIEEIDDGPVSTVSKQQIDLEPVAIFRDSTASHRRTHTMFSESMLIFDCTRFWGFDFAATIGVLSVVLVIYDTFCAVTDPLRYHTRISYLKSWLLIASVWVVSIVITAISALRSKWCHIELETNESGTNKQHPTNPTISFFGSYETIFAANIYALVFSCSFFTLIVLVPIVVVCIMYYKIFSEARQSGLRMRRNGSSPLLQSSLNLNNSGLNAVALSDTQRYPSIFDMSSPDAITMKIDSQQYGTDDSKSVDYIKGMPIATHQYRRYLDIPEGEKQADQPLNKRKRTKSEKSLNGFKPKLSMFRRHFSARHLVSLERTCEVPSFLTKNNNLSRMISGEIRQVHSSPNLQKLSNLEILQKVPYCVNNRSNSSINQATQAPANSARALSYMVSIRHRLSNASSIFKYREESRTARIGTVVVAMLMLSYLPYGLLILLQGRLTFIPNASLCSVLFLLIANVSSPFIFAYRNRRVRRGVCRLFGVDPKSNRYLQKQRMQLRNNQNNAKHVRIHRNLSASNFSLNMLPYKLPPQSMLPIQNEPMHGYVQSRHGSVLVPIDDVETESNEVSCVNVDLDQRKIDENNNRLNKAKETTKPHKGTISLFNCICSSESRKSSVSDIGKEQQQQQQCNHDTKDDAT